MIKISDSDKKISISDITEFEIKSGLLLPENYKKFLLKFNGGVLYDYHRFLSSFNSVKYSENNTSLEESYEIYCKLNKDLDVNFLPIAASHSDNPITLFLQEGENYGKIFIFYLDRDEEPEIVANSLEELLEVNSIDEI
ncbi:SMI1/KNR4 family protein [Flavobacterium azooxidireducens]|uniref:SMI1/KNR4 family protein n=1 Tax=Flavobacterium azooxidireducens TaxID=1871076 RepID=A0ABY4KCT4_9FLAO|nr:SMI1/KNR4 family protein [Flavobacterium azooxidireducens]UPQ78120.1 SMI1/KNR4 family protein [Flavobacterium azooxidireducens]